MATFGALGSSSISNGLPAAAAVLAWVGAGNAPVGGAPAMAICVIFITCTAMTWYGGFRAFAHPRQLRQYPGYEQHFKPHRSSNRWIKKCYMYKKMPYM